MKKHDEINIHLKASKALECLTKSTKTFEELLKKDIAFNYPDYSLARNLLRDGEAFYDEMMKSAKKLLGPLPEDASDEYDKWRVDCLQEKNVLAKSKDFESLETEFLEDKLLRKWMTVEEIKMFLRDNFYSQKSGKRKLANIKVRMIIDKLKELLHQARDLQRETFKKQQNSMQGH